MVLGLTQKSQPVLLSFNAHSVKHPLTQGSKSRHQAKTHQTLTGHSKKKHAQIPRKNNCTESLKTNSCSFHLRSSVRESANVDQRPAQLGTTMAETETPSRPSSAIAMFQRTWASGPLRPWQCRSHRASERHPVPSERGGFSPVLSQQADEFKGYHGIPPSFAYAQIPRDHTRVS